MKKNIILCFAALTLLLSGAISADTMISPIQVDGAKILERALQKDAINFKGELATGDSANEVYGYKTGYLDINNKTTVKVDNVSTTTESKINIRVDSKMDKKSKALLTNTSIKLTKVNNGVDLDPDLMRTVDKYVKGKLTESYYDTTVGEEKVYNIWKRNIVKDFFGHIFTDLGISTSTKNTVLNKIVSKKNIKFDFTDMQKSSNLGMGLKNGVAATTTMVNTDMATKEIATVDRGFSKFLRVKQYLGMINDEDYEIVDLKTKKTVTTLTPVHNMVLTVDYAGLADEAIRLNKVREYSFGMISGPGLTEQEIRKSFEYIYTNLEILIWIDANNYTIKSFKVEPYEIYLTLGNMFNITTTVDINYREDPTRKTGYIYPIPKSYITMKDIKGMLLKK
ncbi:hypothetical protein H7X65_01075 [Candidatus Parcubacteria bacterium]|nr:hypothetical protein [Candidatus Parcubacteria bacterium]